MRRLTNREGEDPRKTVESEHRSMREVARSAINEYTSRRTRRRDEAIIRILCEHARVIERLSEQ